MKEGEIKINLKRAGMLDRMSLFLSLKCLVLLHRKRILIHPRPVSGLGTRLQSILGSGSEKTGK